MTFVSYAQNFEDVMLWRALKDVEKGFYIDVGANDPKLDSVTKAFYDRGWRGINIEPVEAFFCRLEEERPEDINLRLVVADAEATATFYDVAGTGLSTTERTIAEKHRRAGHDVAEIQVATASLASICKDYVKSDVHFLKIDVEGGTSSVVRGFDFGIVRPWIILIEATEPASQVESFADWEDLLLTNDYIFVYEDGLNRFYVAAERGFIVPGFKHPPNVFDDFVMASCRDSEARAIAAEARASETERAARQLLSASFTEQVARTREAEERGYTRTREAEERGHARTREAEERADRVTTRLNEREDLLRAVFESHSWRLTAPVRALSEAARGTLRVLRPTPVAAATRRPHPTIFIECTHTYHSDLNTGIQRVVRNVLRNAPAVARQYGYDVVPVIVEGDRFRFADADRVLADKHHAGTPAASPATLVEEVEPRLPLRQRVTRALHPVWRITIRGLAVLFPFRSARAFIYAPPHQFGLAYCIRLLFWPLRAARRPPPPIGADAPGSLDDFQSCDGSILLLLDSSWTIPIWPGARRFKQRGGLVVGVIYDLIPVTHSHTSVHELTVLFKAWLDNHLRLTDGFVCISQATSAALSDYIRGTISTESGANRAARPHMPIGYFHLGSELDLIGSRNDVRQPILDIFKADRHVFLMVGSIEPRKMHAFALDAFDRFWEHGGSAALVIVGRQSWKTEVFLDRVARHPQLGRQLFMLRDATDAELDHCYRSASSLVIPSEIEGFGLPVVEAFQRGLPVICSDIPVFREIAEGKATFFGLSDPANLTCALESFCRSVDLSARMQRTPQGWINWRQSTEHLLTGVIGMLSRTTD